jgi:hypothetical protein
MRAAAAVLFVLVGSLGADARPQDTAADRFAAACRDLESNDPKRIFSAVQGVSQMGGASLPAIEARARDSKSRVRDYLELAAEEIRSAPHLPGYPAVKRLSMKSSEKNVVELLADLRARTGAALSLDNLLDEEKLPEIPFEIKDATMLEAFDAICHAGNVQVTMQNGQFMLFAGAFQDLPRFFYGHYFLRLGDFDIVKTVTFRKPATQTFNLQMEMVWDPAAAPLRFKPVRIVEALDDRGKSLVLAPAAPDPTAKKENAALDAEEAGANTMLHLAAPSPAATKVSLLRGFATIVLPKSRATVAFPFPQAGQAGSVGDYQFRIVGVDPDQHRVRLTLTSKKYRPEALSAMDVLSQVTLKDWEATSSSAEKSSWNEDALELTVGYDPLRIKDGLARPPEGGPQPPIDKLEISVVTAVQDKRIPFEFRDLKIK